jgi:coatomer subunit gamma
LKNEEALAPILSSQKHLFTSEPQNLTDNDAEYVIKGVKHFFETVIVIQYEIMNTIEDQILSEVQVKITKLESAHGLKLKGMIPLNEDDQIKFNEKRYSYVVLNKDNAQKEFPHINIAQKLTFKITEIDVDTEEDLGSYEEEYTNVWDLIITTKDYLGPSVIMKSFKECWEALGMQGQRDGTLAELN